MDRSSIAKLQSERLVEMVEYVYHSVPYYKEKLDQHGVKPSDIKGIKDIHKLPFMTKQDFRENYPFGLFAKPLKEVVRIHGSSGTTGKPTIVGYTRKDMNTWIELISRLATAGGVTEEDIVQIAFGYGLFTGGFGLHYGCENIGATIVPVSSGNTDRQLMLMKDFGTTVLICTPSYAVYMGEVIEERNIKSKLKLKYGLFGGEPSSEDTRQEIERLLGIVATDNYGLSELTGPGVSYECLYKNGMHIAEDHFYAEVIHPETQDVLPPGEQGELVLTTLTKEAIPVIRYRTRDLTILNNEICECGRTHMRMRKTLGRSDDMVIIRGVNVFPSQIEAVLSEFEDTKPHYQIIVDRVNNLDTFELLVEVSEELFTDKMRDITNFEKRLLSRLESVLGFKVKLKMVEPKTLERFTGKAIRVVDKRKL